MHLSHLKTTPHPVCGKVFLHETDLWCQKCWGLLLEVD